MEEIIISPTPSPLITSMDEGKDEVNLTLIYVIFGVVSIAIILCLISFLIDCLLPHIEKLICSGEGGNNTIYAKYFRLFGCLFSILTFYLLVAFVCVYF